MRAAATSVDSRNDLIHHASGAAAARHEDRRAARHAARRPRGLLTDRERSILVLVGHGCSNKRIAVELRIGSETVKSHLKHVFVKLGTRTRTQSVVRAASLGLV